MEIGTGSMVSILFSIAVHPALRGWPERERESKRVVVRNLMAWITGSFFKLPPNGRVFFFFFGVRMEGFIKILLLALIYITSVSPADVRILNFSLKCGPLFWLLDCVLNGQDSRFLTIQNTIQRQLSGLHFSLKCGRPKEKRSVCIYILFISLDDIYGWW